MSDWIQLNSQELDRVTEEEAERAAHDGIRVEITVSPYDVPEAVKADFDEKKNRLVLQFRYLDDEDWERVNYREQVKLRVGKRSGRLYGIELSPEKRELPDAVNLFLKVAQTVEEYAQDRVRGAAEDNFRVARDLLMTDQIQDLVGPDYRQPV